MKKEVIAFVLLLASILISACGGGGSTHSKPPPPPKYDDMLDASGASILALVSTEAALQLGSMVELKALTHINRRATSGSFDCTSGSYRFSYQSSDEAFAVNVGDTAELEFYSCEDLSLNDTLNGTVRVVVEAVDDEQKLFHLRADFGDLTLTGNEEPPATVMGELLITSQTLEYGAKLTVEPVDTAIRIDMGDQSGVLIIERFMLSKTLNFEDGRYAVAGRGHVTHPFIRKGYEFAFDVPLQGHFNMYPDHGQLTIPITESSSMQLRHGNGEDAIRLLVGRTTTEEVGKWSDIVEGFLWWFPDKHIPYQTAEMDKLRTVARVVGTNLPYDGDSCMGSFPIETEEPLYVQLDRPVNLSGATITMRGSITTEWTRQEITTTAEVRSQGAYVEILPAERLQHNSKYWVINDDELTYHRHLRQVLNCTFTTDDHLIAKAVFNQRLAISGTSIEVDASPSFSKDTPIVSYEWRELSDSPSVIAQPDSARTTIHVETSQQKQALDFELTVTNASGAKQSAVYRIEALRNEAPHEAVLYYQVRNSDGEISTNGSAALMADISTYLFTTDMYDRINVFARSNWRHEHLADPLDLTLFLQGEDGEGELSIGIYDETNGGHGSQNIEAFGLAFHEVTPYERREQTGRFEILELEFDPPRREVTVLAVDFDLNVQPGNLIYAGSVRINSSVPLRTGTLSP